MKILIIVMGILSLLFSCTSRSEKLAEEEKSVQNGYEVKENKSCLDHDTLPGNMFSSNKGNDTIGVCPERFDIADFERHKKDFADNSFIGYYEMLPNDTIKSYMKSIMGDEKTYSIAVYPKDSYLTYEKTYYANGFLKSDMITKTGTNMHIGFSCFYSIDGKLKQEINEDEGYLFTFEQLMHLLENKGIYFPKNQKSYNDDTDSGYQMYKATMGDSTMYTVIYMLPNKTQSILTISGKDGAIIEEVPFIIEDN